MRNLLAFAGAISLALIFSINDDGYVRCSQVASLQTCHSALNR